MTSTHLTDVDLTENEGRICSIEKTTRDGEMNTVIYSDGSRDLIHTGSLHNLQTDIWDSELDHFYSYMVGDIEHKSWYPETIEYLNEHNGLQIIEKYSDLN